jgi:hypothetical protein
MLSANEARRIEAHVRTALRRSRDNPQRISRDIRDLLRAVVQLVDTPANAIDFREALERLRGVCEQRNVNFPRLGNDEGLDSNIPSVDRLPENGCDLIPITAVQESFNAVLPRISGTEPRRHPYRTADPGLAPHATSIGCAWGLVEQTRGLVSVEVIDAPPAESARRLFNSIRKDVQLSLATAFVTFDPQPRPHGVDVIALAARDGSSVGIVARCAYRVIVTGASGSVGDHQSALADVATQVADLVC